MTHFALCQSSSAHSRFSQSQNCRISANQSDNFRENHFKVGASSPLRMNPQLLLIKFVNILQFLPLPHPFPSTSEFSDITGRFNNFLQADLLAEKQLCFCFHRLDRTTQTAGSSCRFARPACSATQKRGRKN